MSATKRDPAADLRAELRAARARRKAERAALRVATGVSFRDFLSDPDYFPGGVALSDAIWAIVDASDGRPDLIDPELCRRLFNCDPAALPRPPIRVVGIGSGRRSGKTSRLLAPKAVHLAWTTPLPNLRRGEVARVAIVSADLDSASATLNYVKGLIAGSEVLRNSVVSDVAVSEDPEDIGNRVAVVLRRPDGHLVDITVRAASRGGRTVRSRTLVGLILDEACFLFGSDGATPIDQLLFDAALPAIEPGGQAWIASSPWIDGEGLLESLIAQNWKDGTQGKTALVAARIATSALRPAFDADGSIERSIRAQPDGDVTAERELYGRPMPSGSRRFFLPEDVAAAMALVPGDVSPDAVGAGADYGHTSDRSALAVSWRYSGAFFAVPFVLSIPTIPDRRPSQTYREVALAAKLRGARVIASDGHYKESVREEYEQHGMSYTLAPSSEVALTELRQIARERRLALGVLPEVDRALLSKQFSAVLSIPLAGGKTRVVVPRSSAKDSASGKGTTHCDELVAVALAVHEAGGSDAAAWARTVDAPEAPVAATASPVRGSAAYLSAARNGGVVSSGKFW